LPPDPSPAVRSTEAFFLPGDDGGRFCVLHRGVRAARPRGALVYVHPFGEEMNKARRMATLAARSLAAAGFSVLTIDLYGCGDSAGDFADATWDRWIDDVIAAARWLREHAGVDPMLWGLRAGCLLAKAAAQGLEYSPNLLFWQPVVSGAQHLQQFLRLRVAQHVAGGAGEARIGTKELRAELQSGMTLEIAGYALAPKLALGLDAAELAPPRLRARVGWLEVSSSDPPELSPAGRLRMQAWQAAGHDVAECAVGGLAFWQTQEIAECAALVEATRAVALDWHR
jgi:exosortase A-associated hydrolase 2